MPDPGRKRHKPSASFDTTSIEAIEDETEEGIEISVPKSLGNVDTTTAKTSPGEVTGETKKEGVQKGRTWSDVFMDYLSGAIPIKSSRIRTIIPLLWIGLIAWLFAQDNQNNKLDNIEGIKWFLVKVGLSIVLFFIALILFWVFNRGENQTRNK